MMATVVRKGSPQAAFVPGTKRGPISRKVNAALDGMIDGVRSYVALNSHEKGDSSTQVMVNVFLKADSDLAKVREIAEAIVPESWGIYYFGR